MVARTMENRLANTVGARPGSAEDGRENDLLDEIDAESFPASDPPPWPATHLGSPCRESEFDPFRERQVRTEMPRWRVRYDHRCRQR